MGLTQSTASVTADAHYSYSAGGLPGTPGGPPAVPCPSQFLCTRQDVQCTALADFYCATNGWLWAQGTQGVGWSSAAGCYASTPALGCVAPVPPVATEYCTFYGVNCTSNGTVVALNLTGLGTTSATVSFMNPLAQLSSGWGASTWNGARQYTGTYIPKGQSAVLTPEHDFITCDSNGGYMLYDFDENQYSCYEYPTVALNASGIPGPWYCPSYLSGNSSATPSSPGDAWSVTASSSPLNGWVSCQVGLVNDVVTYVGAETITCYGCYMYGSLPASIGNLTGLTTLMLNTNLLSGALPAALGLLTNLVDLEVAGNQLSGALPASLGSLTLLETLDLNNNAITGSLPDLGNLSALTYLCVFAIALLPVFPPIAHSLRRMLASNQLEGEIPESLCGTFQQNWTFAQGEFLPAPIGIFLTNNLLSGTLPDCLGNMTGLLCL